MVFDSSNTKRVLPFGMITIAFVAVALVGQWLFFEEDFCSPLKERLDHQGSYFLRWQAPNLMLILADKTQYTVEGESQSQACKKLHEQLKAGS